MNTPGNRPVFAAATVAVALILGAAGGAQAQQAGDTSGGTTSDNTSAGNVNGGGLPQIQQQGDVSFVSGGVGLDESKALQTAQHQWPLALRFTGPGSDFLADVHVRIVDSHNGEVLNTVARGPYMLVKLPPGRYTVHAAYEHREQARSATVSGNGSTRLPFYWNVQ